MGKNPNLLYYKPKKEQGNIWETRGKDLGLVEWYAKELPNVQYSIGIGNQADMKAMIESKNTVVMGIESNPKKDD